MKKDVMRKILVKAIAIAIMVISTACCSLMTMVAWVSERTERPLYLLGGTGIVIGIVGVVIFVSLLERTDENDDLRKTE